MHRVVKLAALGYARNMPLTISEEKPKITKFLTANQIGTLATADSSGQPHAATIYFVIDPDLNLYFITKEKTTKHHDLQQNPKASVAVHEPATQTTVQLNGKAEIIDDPSRVQQTFEHILAIATSTSQSGVPPISRLNAGNYVGYKLVTSTVRMATYTKPEQGDYEDIFEVAVNPDSSL